MISTATVVFEGPLSIGASLMFFLAPFLLITGVVAVVVYFPPSDGMIEQPTINHSNHPSPNATLHDCPICFSLCEFRCSTSCGHRFCTGCVLAYWRSRGRSQRIVCHCCRAPVCLLLEEFSEVNNAETARLRQIRLAELADYNSVHGMAAAATWREVISTAPTLLRALIRYLSDNPVQGLLALLGAVSRLGNSLTVAALLAYILSPVDFLPEVCEQMPWNLSVVDFVIMWNLFLFSFIKIELGVIGLADDVVVAAVLALIVASCFRGVLVHEARRLS
jgi:uncharacterized membrane protein YkvA (DUF1232 family)